MQNPGDKASSVADPVIPSWPWPHGRRLSDKILQVFRYACAMGHHQDAKTLLDLCDQVEARRVIRFGGDRRHTVGMAQAARQWLNRLTSKPTPAKDA
jgi:hypothetical protein